MDPSQIPQCLEDILWPSNRLLYTLLCNDPVQILKALT